MVKKSENSLLDSLKKALEDLKSLKKQQGCSVNIEDIDVYAIRKKYHLSQGGFSRHFGFSLRTLQQWEQGRRKPHGPARVLLKTIDCAPDGIEKALRLRSGRD